MGVKPRGEKIDLKMWGGGPQGIGHGTSLPGGWGKLWGEAESVGGGGTHDLKRLCIKNLGRVTMPSSQGEETKTWHSEVGVEIKKRWGRTRSVRIKTPKARATPPPPNYSAKKKKERGTPQSRIWVKVSWKVGGRADKRKRSGKDLGKSVSKRSEKVEGGQKKCIVPVIVGNQENVGNYHSGVVCGGVHKIGGAWVVRSGRKVGHSGGARGGKCCKRPSEGTEWRDITGLQEACWKVANRQHGGANQGQGDARMWGLQPSGKTQGGKKKKKQKKKKKKKKKKQKKKKKKKKKDVNELEDHSVARQGRSSQTQKQ